MISFDNFYFGFSQNKKTVVDFQQVGNPYEYTKHIHIYATQFLLVANLILNIFTLFISTCDTLISIHKSRAPDETCTTLNPLTPSYGYGISCKMFLPTYTTKQYTESIIVDFCKISISTVIKRWNNITINWD